MAVCPECLAQLDSLSVSGCWNCKAGFGDGSSWKPTASRLAPKLATSPGPPRPLPLFGQAVTYVVGGSILFAVCATGALATAFAGSGHGQPAWLIPYLALTQALPLLLFFVSSWSVLHSIANRARFSHLHLYKLWYRSIAVYLSSFAVLFIVLT